MRFYQKFLAFVGAVCSIHVAVKNDNPPVYCIVLDANVTGSIRYFDVEVCIIGGGWWKSRGFHKQWSSTKLLRSVSSTSLEKTTFYNNCETFRNPQKPILRNIYRPFRPTKPLNPNSWSMRTARWMLQAIAILFTGISRPRASSFHSFRTWILHQKPLKVIPHGT